MDNVPLRTVRERIYRKHIQPQGLFPCVNGRVLSEEKDQAKRQANFLVFVDQYFSKQTDSVGQNGSPSESGSTSSNLPSKLVMSSDGYKAFAKFSDTPYGSSVIKEMVDGENGKKYQGFFIGESLDTETRASYSGILISWKFPFKPRFIHSGQSVDTLAILYHEFAHTMVFQPSSQQKVDRNIRGERISVMKFENPVRFLHKLEPRYSYVHHDGSETINILTGEVGPGVMAVNKYNPAELVKRTHKDALK